jgi:hypothetical protein
VQHTTSIKLPKLRLKRLDKIGHLHRVRWIREKEKAYITQIKNAKGDLPTNLTDTEDPRHKVRMTQDEIGKLSNFTLNSSKKQEKQTYLPVHFSKNKENFTKTM